MHNMRQAVVSQVPSALGMRVHPSPRVRWVRHVAVCLLIGASMLAVIRWWAWAWAPACVIGILYLMYASIEMVDLRSRALRAASVSDPRPDTRSGAGFEHTEPQDGDDLRRRRACRTPHLGRGGRRQHAAAWSPG